MARRRSANKSKKTSAPPERASQPPPPTEHAPPPPKGSRASTESRKQFDLNKLIDPIFISLAPEPPAGSDKKRDKIIREHIKHELSESPVADKYNILILYDEGRMIRNDADNIYSAAADFTEKRPLILILYSTGGFIGSAYLIGKLCREYSNEKFVVVVPRQAKSGATLICCAADEIHMGSLSELGPIDPQIKGLPALGLKTSVEHIADLVGNYPHAADMFAKYLNMSLQPIDLGYCERVAESAAQYAERLLKTHASILKRKPTQTARELVYSYKDHSFVIDKSEASDIFGDKVIKTDSEEYKLGNTIYAALTFISRLADIMGHYFYFIGSAESQGQFRKKRPTTSPGTT